MKNKPLTVYWAGDLFDFKDLTGNMELAAAVEKVSCGRYQVKLPQFAENNITRNITDIRDGDLELLISCDAIVANFDGPDLDSGTVVEFCFAKMLDMPAVLLRTDFRTGSDQGPGGDPWNLMCSGYPRTNNVVLHGMKIFHEHHGDLTAYHADIAEKIVAALDKSCAEKALFPPDILQEHYKRIIAAAGGSLAELFPPERIAGIIAGRSS